MTKPAAPTRPQPSLLPWGLTACVAIAGPSLLDTAAPALMLASVAIGLTALVIGFALWQRTPSIQVPVPARRSTHTLGWSPP